MESKIINGDCIEEMKKIPSNSIDLVLTDPPYNITKCEWDKPLDFELLWKELKRIGKENCRFIFTSFQPFTTDLINSNRSWFKYCWVWNKVGISNGITAKYNPLRCHEDIVVFYKKFSVYNPIMRIGKKWHRGGIKTQRHKFLGGNREHLKPKSDDSEFKYPITIITFPNTNKMKNKHPTQKPIELFEYLIKSYSNKNQVVLDCFGGSGTTAIACCNLQRNFIVIEKELSYFQVIKDRLIENGKIPTQATPTELSFNKDYQETSAEVSQIPNGTSDNSNIMFNLRGWLQSCEKQ